MSKNLAGCILFCLVLFIQPLQAQESGSSQYQSIKLLMEELVSDEKFNGVVLVAEKGNIVFSNAFGSSDVTGNSALTVNSVFNLASVSKQFVAEAVLILVEQGALGLDDKAAKYLPELDTYPAITIRHLLNHTSGIEDYIDICETKCDPNIVLTNEAVLALFVSERPALRFQPGDRFEYSNSGYVALATIVERVSSLTFPDFMAERVFKPLGMVHSAVVNLNVNQNFPGRVFGFKGAQVNDLMFMDGVYGDGAIYSSATDLLLWDKALYGNQLVNKKLQDSAFKPAQLNNGDLSYYGFGWQLEAENPNVVKHTGGWVGFVSFIRRDMATQSTLIVLDNASNNRHFFEVITKLQALLYNKTI